MMSPSRTIRGALRAASASIPLRRGSLVLLATLGASACAHRVPEVEGPPVPVEALTDATSIRRRCQDPEGVIAGRAFCVLKDLPSGATPAP